MASIIQRNIAQLGKKFLKNVNYKDIDYRGFISASADPTLESGQVLINDLKLWIQSSKGDYYRRMSFGGFFDTIQQYPLNADGEAALSVALKSAITANFKTVEILEFSVTADYTRRAWKLKLVVRDTITGALAPVTTIVDAAT